ncbi:MAG: hypothetical protein AB1798_19935 [Spirochaetota bacterium]
MFGPIFRIPDTCCEYCGIGNGHQPGCPETIKNERLKKKAKLHHSYGYDSVIRRLVITEELSKGTSDSVVNDRAYQIGRSMAEHIQQMSRKQRELLNLLWEICRKQPEDMEGTGNLGPSPCVKASKG